MWNAFWLWSDRLTILFACVGAGFAIWGWIRTTELIHTNRLNAARRKAEITIRFTCKKANGEAGIIDLPYRPRRDQLCRAELMGIIGLYTGAQRFETDFLRSVLEDGSLARVIAGENDEGTSDELLVISCSETEFSLIDERIKAQREKSELIDPKEVQST